MPPKKTVELVNIFLVFENKPQILKISRNIKREDFEFEIASLFSLQIGFSLAYKGRKGNLIDLIKTNFKAFLENKNICHLIKIVGIEVKSKREEKIETTQNIILQRQSENAKEVFKVMNAISIISKDKTHILNVFQILLAQIKLGILIDIEGLKDGLKNFAFPSKTEPELFKPSAKKSSPETCTNLKLISEGLILDRLKKLSQAQESKELCGLIDGFVERPRVSRNSRASIDMTLMLLQESNANFMNTLRNV